MARVVRTYVDEDGIEVEEIAIGFDDFCRYMCEVLAAVTYPPGDPEECRKHCMEMLAEDGDDEKD